MRDSTRNGVEDGISHRRSKDNKTIMKTVQVLILVGMLAFSTAKMDTKREPHQSVRGRIARDIIHRRPARDTSNNLSFILDDWLFYVDVIYEATVRAYTDGRQGAFLFLYSELHDLYQEAKAALETEKDATFLAAIEEYISYIETKLVALELI